MRGSEDVDVRPTIADIVHSRGILLVGSVIDADVVVCENPGNPPGIIKWALFLTGGIICTHRALAGLDGGAYITYKAAISCKEKRFIMITPSCQREHPDYCSILRQAMAKPCSNWVEADEDTWCEKVVSDSALPVKQRRPLKYLGLVGASKVGSISEHKHLFTMGGLLQQALQH